jgi:TatD DNase family protein
VVERACAAGVTQIVLPAVDLGSCAQVRGLAHEYGFVYALGVHPLFVMSAGQDDLHHLRQQLDQWHTDPRCVAVGEIGLDDFAPPPGCTEKTGKPSINHPAYWQQQIHFLRAQLQMAREFDLPVVLHMRRCADELIKHLRRAGVRGGIVHAFNGSEQQAWALLDLGFKLGFGGAMTFERALQIRRLAQSLPLEAIVLETDAPDMPPQWLCSPKPEGKRPRNEPCELPRMAQVLAGLRGIDANQVAAITQQNTAAALPKLQSLAY